MNFEPYRLSNKQAASLHRISTGRDCSNTAISPKRISTVSGFTGWPARPTAAMIRPQFASAPYTADFTRLEPMTVFTIARAASSLSAPTTCTSISFVAPSPSRAIALASYFANILERLPRTLPNPDVPDAALHRPPSPLAIATTMSFVLVSPSTVIILNVISVTCAAAAAGIRSQSRVGCHETEHRRHVRMNHPRTFRCPGNMNRLAVNAQHDARHLLHQIRRQDRLAEIFAAFTAATASLAARSMPLRTLSIGSSSPMTPVLQPPTWCSATPSAFATCCAHRACVVFALLACARVRVAAVDDHRLQLAACADALLRHAQRCRLKHVQRVHAAAAAGTSHTIAPRS